MPELTAEVIRLIGAVGLASYVLGFMAAGVFFDWGRRR